jgi:hypothetical protein
MDPRIESLANRYSFRIADFSHTSTEESFLRQLEIFLGFAIGIKPSSFANVVRGVITIVKQPSFSGHAT